MKPILAIIISTSLFTYSTFVDADDSDILNPGLGFIDSTSTIASSAVELVQLSKLEKQANNFISLSRELTKKVNDLRALGINTEYVARLDADAAMYAKKGLAISDDVSDARSGLNKLGVAIGLASTSYDVYKDVKKYGTSESELTQTALLGTADTIAVFVNAVNPFALAGVVSYGMEFHETDSALYNSATKFVEAVGDPFGTLVDLTRTLRETLDTTINSDQSVIAMVDASSQATLKLIRRGVFADPKSIEKVISSDSVDDFRENTEYAMSKQKGFIDASIKLNRGIINDLISIKSEISMVDPARSTRITMYEGMISTLENNQEHLSKLSRYISDEKNKSVILGEYADLWIMKEASMAVRDVSKIEKSIKEAVKELPSKPLPSDKGIVEKRISDNDEMQQKISAITNGNFSAVGSSARYFKGTSAADRLAYNNLKVAELKKQTVQEGSTYVNGQIIKAPVDVVLRWGANPSDLDSHLTGPTGNPNNANERFHTYYANRGSLDSAPNAMLYHDDTDSFGPEQTRINVVNPGVYRFYVNDFTNLGTTGSTALSNSGATVTIHQSGNTSLPEGQNLGAQVAQVNVPTGRTGNTWQAFELDSRTGVLNRTTEFRDVSNPVNVPFNQ